jgi:hypothetical protein
VCCLKNYRDRWYLRTALNNWILNVSLEFTECDHIITVGPMSLDIARTLKSTVRAFRDLANGQLSQLMLKIGKRNCSNLSGSVVQVSDWASKRWDYKQTGCLRYNVYIKSVLFRFGSHAGVQHLKPPLVVRTQGRVKVRDFMLPLRCWWHLSCSGV